jgi:type VI protein secretion system component Hcp
MAKTQSSDLIMMFVRDGTPIEADSRTDLQWKDKARSQLLRGFKKGCMFEIDKFSFEIGTQDQDTRKKDKDADKDEKKKKPSSASGDRQAWRAGGAIAYPVDVQPLSFTRDIDRASSQLLQDCIDCHSYDRATLIKRKAIGNAAAGEAFLRFDFVGVLVTSVGWADDDEVQETCQFIFRSVTISYCPQLPDGSLGAIVPAFWSMVANAQPFDLRSLPEFT